MIPVQYAEIVSTLPNSSEERKAIQLLADAIQAAPSGNVVNLVGSNVTDAVTPVEVYSDPNRIAGLVAGNNITITKSNSQNYITVSTLMPNIAEYQKTLIQAVQPNSVDIFDGSRTISGLVAGYGIDPVADLSNHTVTMSLNSVEMDIIVTDIIETSPNVNINYANFSRVLFDRDINSDKMHLGSNINSYTNSGIKLVTTANAIGWSVVPVNGTVYNMLVTGSVQIDTNLNVGTNAFIGTNLNVGTNAFIGTNLNVGVNLNVGNTLSVVREIQLGPVCLVNDNYVTGYSQRFGASKCREVGAHPNHLSESSHVGADYMFNFLDSDSEVIQLYAPILNLAIGTYEYAYQMHLDYSVINDRVYNDYSIKTLRIVHSNARDVTIQFPVDWDTTNKPRYFFTDPNYNGIIECPFSHNQETILSFYCVNSADDAVVANTAYPTPYYKFFITNISRYYRANF